MPYIEPKIRVMLGAGVYPRDVGELTYVIQQTINNYLSEHRLRYQALAEVLGALEGAKADFINRVLLPYETKKRKENGDVWT